VPELKSLIKEILGTNPTLLKTPEHVTDAFFRKTLSLEDLRKVHDAIAASSVTIPGGAGGSLTIPSVMRVDPDPGRTSSEKPFLLLSQIHGNEPAGLGAALLTMLLAESGKLDRPVYLAIGNTLAAGQYFDALAQDSTSPQEVRDRFRAGVGPAGQLLRDMNRLPNGFKDMDPADPYIKRAQELWQLSGEVSGVLDIHTARGKMVVVTDHREDAQLKYSPIRDVLTGLLESIAGATSSKPLKLVLDERPNITSLTGIEAGRHEDPQAPGTAAAFALALYHNLGITQVPPLSPEKEDGKFHFYEVGPKVNFSDLKASDSLPPDDLVYTVRTIGKIDHAPEGTTKVLVEGDDKKLSVVPIGDYSPAKGKLRYAVYQFGEMEYVGAGQTVAVGVPSGTRLSTTGKFHALFVAKSAELYQDPSVVLLPLKGDALEQKFAYPSTHAEVSVEFPEQKTGQKIT
jgi:hypothetical protein